MRRITLLIALVGFLTGQTAAAAPIVDVPLSYASTGVATAQQQLQLSGRGVAVAILDTGVDYSSSSLFGAGCRHGGAFSRSGTCRITAARDFVGDVSTLERASFKPDNDPMDCRSPDGSHGTAVASIAVGDSSSNVPKGGKPWRGVAYASSIQAYKIAGSCSAAESGVSKSAAVQAINQAAAVGADVINMSFGPDFRGAAWRDDKYGPALLRAVQSGTLVAAACGNDGDFGPFLTDNSMVPPHMISVASAVVRGQLPAATMRFNQPVTAAGSNTLPVSAGIVFASAMKAEAEAVARKMASLKLPLQVVTAQPLLACGSSLSNKAQVRGKLVLIKRGECPFSAKANAAAAAGAVAVIFFNFNNDTSAVDGPGSFTPGFADAPRIPAWGLENAAGEALLKAVKKGRLQLVKLQLSKRQLEVKSMIAPSSSSGPPATLEMLPTITAPGEDVRATLAGNEFGVESGTSLASPLVTGSLALLKQARPDLFPQQPGSKLPAGRIGRTNQAAAYNAVVATARPLASVMFEGRQGGWAEPVSRAGAGLIQLDAAIRNPTVLSPNYFQLRSNTRRQTLTFTATIDRRFGPQEITYVLGHRPAAAVDIGSASWWKKDVPDLLQQPLAASVRFAVAGRAVSEITIRRGGSVTVQASFELPEELASKPLLHSGFITLAPKQQRPAVFTVAEQAVAGSAKPRVALAAVPLVLPFQGFSRNYTTLPILPTAASAAPNSATFTTEPAEMLQGQLSVCYADFAETSAVEADDYSSNQDGFFIQQQVDACLYQAANPTATKKLPRSKLENTEGGLIVAAALLRPAMRMRLMLFDAIPSPCSQSKGGKAKPCSQRQAGAAPKLIKGALVGEMWRKTDNSRDLPQSLWAYTGPFFGFVEVRDSADKLVRYVRVSPKRKYRMQLWIEGPVAAADRAAGEQPHTFKHDVPGVFEFV